MSRDERGGRLPSILGVGLVLIALTSSVSAQAGPDLVVSDIFGLQEFSPGGTVRSLSVGVGICNAGAADLPWDALSPEHPVVVTNLYRVWEGRFEQIGMSWAHHVICALDLAGACSPCVPAGCEALGVGCETESSASIMGNPARFGPRIDVEPRNGVFAYPPSLAPSSTPIIGGRLLVEADDLDPALYPGARYFVEVQAISFADSLTGFFADNVAWREATITAGQLSLTGAVRVAEPALTAWQEVHSDVELDTFSTVFDGVFHAAARAVDTGAGWRYDYAVFNLNSQLAAGSFRVPGAGSASNFTFHDIDYHSGEPIDGTDWALALTASDAEWSTESSLVDPNANALRWGTTYSFGFTSSDAPTAGSVVLTPFYPGMSPNPTFSLPVPDGTSGATFVRGDSNSDLTVDVADVIFTLAAQFVPGSPTYACVDAADANDDGAEDISDAIFTLALLFVPGSPPAPPPSGSCGPDPTPDALGCDVGCP